MTKLIGFLLVGWGAFILCWVDNIFNAYGASPPYVMSMGAIGLIVSGSLIAFHTEWKR